jgi:hypothetical protein
MQYWKQMPHKAISGIPLQPLNAHNFNHSVNLLMLLIHRPPFPARARLGKPIQVLSVVFSTDRDSAHFRSKDQISSQRALCTARASLHGSSGDITRGTPLGLQFSIHITLGVAA